MAKGNKKKGDKKKGNKNAKVGNKNKAAATGSADAQIVRKLDGSIALSKLKHVIMEKKGKGKKKIECIVLPIDSNFLLRGKDGALYLNVRVNIKDGPDQFDQHGFISQQVPGPIWKDASDEEKEAMKKTPILGGVKDWEYEAGSSNTDNSGSAGAPVGEDDDLPF